MTEIEQQKARELSPAEDLALWLDKLTPHMEQMGVEPSRFARVVVQQFHANRELLECDRNSLAMAVLKSAQLDLEPGAELGLSWLIPRTIKGQKQVTWMIGYRGMIELARRAGIVVHPDTVCEHDQFRVRGGTDPGIDHVYADGDRGRATHWYAVAQWPDRRHQHVVLDRADVERRRDQGYRNSPAWTQWYDRMAQKSAIRALWNQMPMTVEMQDAAAHDEQVLQLPPLATPSTAGPALAPAPAHVDPDTGEITPPTPPTDDDDTPVRTTPQAALEAHRDTLDAEAQKQFDAWLEETHGVGVAADLDDETASQLHTAIVAAEEAVA